MNKKTNVENRVLAILRDYPETRYDDMLLLLEYYDRYSCLPMDQMSFADVMCNYKAFGLPCLMTVERARRRVQSLFPDVSRSADAVQDDGHMVVVLHMD